MDRPHLRDVPVDVLPEALRARGFPNPGDLAHRVGLAIHRDGALGWDEVDASGRIGWKVRARLSDAFDLSPRLETLSSRDASDGATRKWMFRTAGPWPAAERIFAPREDPTVGPPAADGQVVEFVLIRHWDDHTLCVSSQAGCAMGCSFCATGVLGLRRNLTAGEMTEALVRVQRDAGVRVTDVVFMGMGEPLHNLDQVLAACTNMNHASGHGIARRRITLSTAGLVPGIRRLTRERCRFRLHLSLHSAIQETRERIMPIARLHPLPELLDAMREHQRDLALKWITLQYVALPDVNMDDAHVDALGRELTGLRYILNVIPWNDTGAAHRAPTWDEVRDFTARLRRLRCPIKVRYSAGKSDGMGCGQLAAETVAAAPTGHMLAPPGVFTA